MHVIEWAAWKIVDKNDHYLCSALPNKQIEDRVYIHRGCKLVTDTSQGEIKQDAIRSLYNEGVVRTKIMEVIVQCDQEHAQNNGDITMSLNGYFDPFD
jgi:hypothetical protein